MSKIRVLRVDADRWPRDVDYRREQFVVARRWALEISGVVQIRIDDKNKTVMATFDARFWVPIPSWARSSYRTPEP